jgi:hypothetical protein
MPAPFLLVLAATTAWSMPLADDCLFAPNRTGTRLLVACRPDDTMLLTLVDATGKRVPVEVVDADIAEGGVPTGPAAWSPSGDLVALEIGLMEEPGVLLIDTGAAPRAVFVDAILADDGVSGARPQWDRSGAWLLFQTSGTGDWDQEGVYAVRVRDRVLFRLLAVVPRRMQVAGDMLYLTEVDRADPALRSLVAYDLPKLLRDATRVGAIEAPPRERATKN